MKKYEILKRLTEEGYIEVIDGSLDTERGWVTIRSCASGKVATVNKEY